MHRNYFLNTIKKKQLLQPPFFCRRNQRLHHLQRKNYLANFTTTSKKQLVMSDIIGYNEPLTIIACNSCKHFWRDKKGFTCKAFPDDIPHEILMGSNMHTKQFDGQENDIVYELIEH